MSDRIPFVGSYKLTQTQKLLLQATLLQGQAALTAWEQWESSVDIEVLDPQSYALLPQVYQNLLAHGVEDAHMARLKGIYRRNWYANQLRLKQLKILLSHLKDAGIEVILLGDAALCCLVDQTYRPISHLHLLVRSAELERAIQQLTSLNWQVATATTYQFIHLQDEQKNSLYLQGRLFWAIPQDYIDEQVWQYAIPNGSNLAGYILNPTDQLLDVCTRTFIKSRSPEISGIADALMLIQQAGDDLDWIRLITQAQRYQMILPVRNMLLLLQQVLQLAIPNWVIPALLQMPIAQTERLNYQVLAGEQRSFVLMLFAYSIRPLYHLKNRLLGLIYGPFPGKQILKHLLLSKKSTFK
ncbi:nucleotidyltransferase family protein [Fortiea contorta]|uniref:nucleotidyltransferase family protein n=1 Tax=Fortiea contorta TaxID=1892405 RepID=UPI00034D748D|nr:nucleotidyltransferase family protein [Fortiea contorta]